jgi:molecular chaperone DnaK
MAILGIDLGTSNTLVAKLNSNGEPEIIEINGDKLIPSVVYMEEQDGNVMVGNHALDMWADPGYETSRGFRRWKLMIGEERIIRQLQFAGGKEDRNITPEDLTTLVVEYLVRTISQGDDGEKVEEILVTVPHGWRREKPEKCRTTRLAASRARLNGVPVKVQELTVSEPVAAAAYWLWVARSKSSTDSFNGKNLMVCDVGGGTFDISLVQVGDINKPLDVVNAENNNYAGDYTDALLCTWACGRFNDQFGTSHPTSPEEILTLIESDQHHWLREWFLAVKKNIKECLCERIEMVLQRGRSEADVKSVKCKLQDPHNNSMQLEFTVADFVSCMEPFYEVSRKLIRNFLNRIKASNRAQLPYALVFAGGGSRIYGLKDHVILPVFKEVYDNNQSLVNEIISRISTNLNKRDQVIAMGAALIANKVVSVQERLLHDIGLVVSLGNNLMANLELQPGTEKVIVSPLVCKSTLLPLKYSSDDFGLPTNVTAGEDFELDIIIDDDSNDPWIQHWDVPHPTNGRDQSIRWEIAADTDGALTMAVKPASGEDITVQGKLERKRTGRASIMIGNHETLLPDLKKIPRISPQKIQEAFNKNRGVI